MIRTVADLEGADLIDTPHIAEALQYRKRDGEQESVTLDVQRRRLREEISVVSPEFGAGFGSFDLLLLSYTQMRNKLAIDKAIYEGECDACRS